MIPQYVDDYLATGCMRCSYGGTPDCKVHTWTEALKALRKILLESELTEKVKWSVPCYTWQGQNVIILSAFKEFVALQFFKGALLEDPQGILTAPGKNSQASRYLKFTTVQDIQKMASVVKAYINQAIEIEKSGRKVDFKAKHELEYPEELQHALDQDPALRNAFESLTPGRQRGYVLHFSQAKQSATCQARIEKCIPMIMEGVGLQGR